MLAGKHIIVGISGGIAAYKSLFLIRLLKKAGAEVKTVLTPNALEFVTRLSVETLSENHAYVDVFEKGNSHATEHIALVDWADAMIVAPATANIIGKFAHGIADDALSTIFLAFHKTVLLAPAMNHHMYENQAVQDNLKQLSSRGIRILDPEWGSLACGVVANGRMPEPEFLEQALQNYFNTMERYAGIKVLVTAGPTLEPIDPVRYISNYSSGLMGYSIANELARQGAQVVLISGKVHLDFTLHPAINLVKVITAAGMYQACLTYFKDSHICIMAAAVADFSIKNPQTQKIKKKDQHLVLELVPTQDILKELGHLKTQKQTLVGFALETQNEKSHALKKLEEKNLDAIILNSLSEKGAGFEHPTNKISIFSKKKKEVSFPLKPKTEVAKDIIDFIFLNFINSK